MGSHSYLQNMNTCMPVNGQQVCFQQLYDRTSTAHADQPSYLQEQYRVPHLQNLYAGATHLTPEQEAAMHQNDDHMHGADSYLLNLEDVKVLYTKEQATQMINNMNVEMNAAID